MHETAGAEGDETLGDRGALGGGLGRSGRGPARDLQGLRHLPRAGGDTGGRFRHGIAEIGARPRPRRGAATPGLDPPGLRARQVRGDARRIRGLRRRERSRHGRRRLRYPVGEAENLARSRLRPERARPGGLHQLARRQGLRLLAQPQDRPGVPPAERGGVGVRGPGRDHDGAPLGFADRLGPGQLRRLRQPLGRSPAVPGGLVRRQPLRPPRHARQQPRVGRGLLPQELQGGAQRRPGAERRRLRQAGDARRFVGERRQAGAGGEPQRPG